MSSHYFKDLFLYRLKYLILPRAFFHIWVNAMKNHSPQDIVDVSLGTLLGCRPETFVILLSQVKKLKQSDFC